MGCPGQELKQKCRVQVLVFHSPFFDKFHNSDAHVPCNALSLSQVKATVSAYLIPDSTCTDACHMPLVVQQSCAFDCYSCALPCQQRADTECTSGAGTQLRSSIRRSLTFESQYRVVAIEVVRSPLPVNIVNSDKTTTKFPQMASTLGPIRVSSSSTTVSQVEN